MKLKKRKSLKKTLLSKIIIYVAIIIVIITQISIKLASDNIQGLTNNILARESVTYASEIHNWWNSIEERVGQTSDVMRNLPESSYDDTLAMLLKLTELDPDSQETHPHSLTDRDGYRTRPLNLLTDRGIRGLFPRRVRYTHQSPM